MNDTMSARWRSRPIFGFVPLLLALSAATRLGVAAEPARLVTVTLQQGVGGYTGAEDTFLSSWYRPPQSPKEQSFGGCPELKIFDRTGTEHTRALFRFDVTRVSGRIVGG
ncbi:MAG: hypothetical protein NTY17_00830 [Planctomycetia bacterium]|nr:hypothetical protein [Planctomycetia bacterium]